MNLKGIIFSTLLILTATAQAGFEDEFEQAWHVSGPYHAASSSTDGNGNLYVAGDKSRGGFFSNSDLSLSKYDADGTEVWSRTYGTSRNDYAASITTDTAGNVYMAGKTYGSFAGSSNRGGYDLFVSKFDAQGIELWTRQFGGTGDDLPRSIATDSSGNAYLTGVLSQPGASLEADGNQRDNAFISKISPAGSVEWTQLFGTTQGDGGHSITVDPGDNIYVTGRTLGAFDGYANQGDFDIFVSKFTPDGVLLWSRQYGSAEADRANHITADANGNYYLAGSRRGRLFVARFDAGGNEIWNPQYSPADGSGANSMGLDNQGNVYIGYIKSESCARTEDGCSERGFISYFYLRKYTADGMRAWDRRFVSSAFVDGGSIALDSGHRLYLTTNTSYNGYGYAAEIARFDPLSPSTVSSDRFNPGIALEQSGNMITGQAGDNEDLNLNGVLDDGEDLNANAIIDFRSEDGNGDGVLNENEDNNGNGMLDTDTGIAGIELEAGAVNLSLTVDGFIAGALQTGFTISLIDPSIDGHGTLVVSDVAGNTTSRPIALTAPPPVVANECSTATDYFTHASDGRIAIRNWAQSPNDPGIDTPEHVMWVSSNDNPGLFVTQPWISYPSWSLNFELQPGVSGTASVTYGVVDYATSGREYSCGDESFNIVVLAPGEEPPALNEEPPAPVEEEVEAVDSDAFEEEPEVQSSQLNDVMGDSDETQVKQNDQVKTSGGGGGIGLVLLLAGLIVRMTSSRMIDSHG